MSKITKIDHSSASTFRACPRKYFLNYVRNIAPRHGSTALRYGTCWHAALEEFYRTMQANGWTKVEEAISNGIVAASKAWDKEGELFDFYDDYRTMENLAQSMVLYADNFFYDAELEVIELENEFEIEIGDETLFTGRVDMILRMSGALWPVEHKSTSQSLSLQQSRLHRSAQMIGYYYAAKRQYDEHVGGILVNMHQLTASKSKKTEKYGKPRIDFSRVPQVYTMQDISNWLTMMQETAHRIRLAKENELFPMNFDACYNYGRCPYTSLCEAPEESQESLIAQQYIETEPWGPIS